MSELAMKVLQWQSTGNVGVSSATMASIALGMKKNFYGSYFSPPSDPSDLHRCMKLVQCIPGKQHATGWYENASRSKDAL